MNENPLSDKNEKAVRDRLVKLASVPVDTTTVRRRLDALLESATNSDNRPQPRFRFFRPLAAMAATILITLILGLVFLNASAPAAMASPADLARLHGEASGSSNTNATPVSTVNQAHRTLTQQWSDVPELPTPPDGQLNGCCVHQFKGQKVACLLLHKNKIPVTMVVGYAKSLKCEDGQQMECGGHRFTQHRVDDVRIMTTVQNGRFIALISQLPEPEMEEIASHVQF